MLTRSTLTNLTLIAFVASLGAAAPGLWALAAGHRPHAQNIGAFGGPRPGEIRHGAMKIYL